MERTTIVEPIVKTIFLKSLKDLTPRDLERCSEYHIVCNNKFFIITCADCTVVAEQSMSTYEDALFELIKCDGDIVDAIMNLDKLND